MVATQHEEVFRVLGDNIINVIKPYAMWNIYLLPGVNINIRLLIAAIKNRKCIIFSSCQNCKHLDQADEENEKLAIPRS